MVVCLVWIGLYAAFFTVWSPGYFVFWVPVLAPISMLVALALAHYRARRGGVWVNWLVGAWIVLFATLNVQASILPHLRASASPFAVAARDIRAHTLPGDVVLLAGAGDGAQCEVDIPYFADREVVSLHGLLTRAHEDKAQAWDTASAQIALTVRSGHAVYACDELWHNKRTWDALTHRHPDLDPCRPDRLVRAVSADAGLGRPARACLALVAICLRPACQHHHPLRTPPRTPILTCKIFAVAALLLAVPAGAQLPPAPAALPALPTQNAPATAPPSPPLVLDTIGNNVGIAQNTAHSKNLQARILWMDAGANVGNLNTPEKIADVVAKTKASGMNMIVLDVKPIVGETIYPSKFAPKLTGWKGPDSPRRL